MGKHCYTSRSHFIGGNYEIYILLIGAAAVLATPFITRASENHLTNSNRDQSACLELQNSNLICFNKQMFCKNLHD